MSRIREEDEARKRAEAAAAKPKKGNFIQRNLPHADDVGGVALGAGKSLWDASMKPWNTIKDSPPAEATGRQISRVPGAKRAWDEFNNIGTAAAGAVTAPFGRLEIQQQPTGREINRFDPDDNSGRVGSGGARTPILGPVAVRRFSPQTVKDGPKNFLNVDKVRKENQMMRDAGIDIGGNSWGDAYRRVQGTGDQWYETPDVSTGVKVGVGVLADPTTWVPAGGIAKAAKAARISKLGAKAPVLGRVGSKVPAGRKLASGAANLIEGASNPLVTVGAAAGMGGAAELAERAGLGSKGTLLSVLGGAAIGGAVPGAARRGFKGKGVDPLQVRSERDAPTGRPIIKDSRVPTEVREATDGSGRKDVYVEGKLAATITPQARGGNYLEMDGKFYYYDDKKTMDDMLFEVAQKHKYEVVPLDEVRTEPNGFDNSFDVIHDANGTDVVLGSVMDVTGRVAPHLDEFVARPAATGKSTSFSTKEEAIAFLTRGEERRVKPLANKRMWFHSTRGSHEYLDPEYGVGGGVATANGGVGGITQGPGVYLAADPRRSTESYGDRMFGTEFDGTVLDLTERGDLDYWMTVARDLKLTLRPEDLLRYAEESKRNAWSTVARTSKELNNYNFRDALIDQMKKEVDAGPNVYPADEIIADLGIFERAMATGDSDIISKSIVQNSIGKTYDAVFHYSPQADGEVLIVINGEKLRTVVEMNRAGQLTTIPSTLPEIKDSIKATKAGTQATTTQGWQVEEAGTDKVFGVKNRTHSIMYERGDSGGNLTAEIVEYPGGVGVAVDSYDRYGSRIKDTYYTQFDSVDEAKDFIDRHKGYAPRVNPKWEYSNTLKYGEPEKGWLEFGFNINAEYDQYSGSLVMARIMGPSIYANGSYNETVLFEAETEAPLYAKQALETKIDEFKGKWVDAGAVATDPGGKPTPVDGHEFFIGPNATAWITPRGNGLQGFSLELRSAGGGVYPPQIHPTIEAARAAGEDAALIPPKYERTDKPSFREYDSYGGIGEEGQISAEYALGLAPIAAGAGIGYAVDEEEGALAGAGIGAAGVAGVLGGAKLLGRADPKNIPSAAAMPGQPGPPLPRSPLSTSIDRFKVGTAAHERNGNLIGDVVAIDGQSDTLWIQTKNGQVQRPANSVYSFADYSAFLELQKTNRARRKALPLQEMIDRARARNEEYLRFAREAVGSSAHVMARAIPKLGTMVDPGARFATDPVRKRVHSAIIASANMIHRGDSIAVATADKTLKILDPLMGEGRTAGLRRAGAQTASLAAPTAAGMIAAQLTGDEEWNEVGLLGAGVVGSSMSVAQRRGFMHDTPWKDIKPRDPTVLTGAIKNASSQERLIDILQYWDGPDGYDFSTLSPERQAKLTTAKKLWDAEELRQLQEVNAALAVSGQQPIPFRERHGVLAKYTPKSLEKAGITNEYASATDIRVTSFRKEQNIEKRRDLGDTLREVFAKEPSLKLTGGVRDLLVDQIRQQERIKAGSLVTADLLEAGYAKQYPDALAQQSMTPAQRAALKADHDNRTKGGWSAMPGVDDVLFHPEAVKTVKDMLVSGTGSDNVAMNFLDAATNVARTALFVGDLNAWTLQGTMTALQNPVATLKNFIPLVGASAFGEKYANYFKLKHPDLVENAAKRGARSYEHGGLEREFPGVHRVPGVRNLEERAVAFLDVMRLIMQDNITQQEAFLKGLSPSSKKGFRGAVGRGIQGDLGHVGLEAVRLSPAAAGIGAAVLGEGLGGEDAGWEENLMTIALGVGGSMATDAAISRGGQFAMDSRKANGRTSDLAVEAGVIGGKTTNRISGTVNRQQQGISARQAQIERVALMRSPALTRNALILAKLAATDKGPEGALARIYLIKTAVMYGSLMAFVKAAKEGRMPDDDDFDPNNPESPFSPENFGRADLGRGGTISASNPLVSLTRAFLYNDRAAGESGFQRPDASEIGQGLAGWFGNRTPDIAGPLIKPTINKFATGIPDSEVGEAQPGLINRIENKDAFGLFTDFAKTGLPVSAQAAFDTGILNRTAIGQRMGTVKGDPNYNYDLEELAGVGAAWAGLNHNPETLGKELVIRKDEEAEKRFGPGETYNTLNEEQQKVINEKLKRSQSYADAQEGRKLQNNGGEIPGPIDQYIEAGKKTKLEMGQALEAAEARYAQTGDAQEFRKRLAELATERRTRSSQIEKDLGEAHARQRGQDMSVTEWLNRNKQPEDEAVDKYFDLYTRATDKATGDLDFEQLEMLQEEFLSGLDRKTQAYVKRQANFERPLTGGQKEYEAVKVVTKPFFEAREQRFDKLKKTDQFLSEFENYSEFRAFTKSLALQNGISEDQALDAISKTSAGVKVFQKMSEIDGRLMRLRNPDLDEALVKWYGYAPTNPLAKVERKLGRLDAITSAPTPQEYRRGKYSDEVRAKSGFKRRTRLWDIPAPTP